MPTWIGDSGRLVENITIAVEGLGIAGIRHNRIRAQEPAHAGEVIPRVVVDESEVVVVLLAGVAAVGIGLAGGGAVAAEGEVAGAAAGNQPTPIIVAHDAVAAAYDNLPHGDSPLERTGLWGKSIESQPIRNQQE